MLLVTKHAEFMSIYKSVTLKLLSSHSLCFMAHESANLQQLSRTRHTFPDAAGVKDKM